MTTDTRPGDGLQNQRVVVIGSTSGIGRATAELAAHEGAHLVLTARTEARLTDVAQSLGAQVWQAFDATDRRALTTFFENVGIIDHIFVGAGNPYYAPLTTIDTAQVASAFDDHVLLMIDIARLAAPSMRKGGTIIFMAGTAARRGGSGQVSPGAISAAMSAAAKSLAVEIAPARVNVIAAGFVDTPLSALLLGDALDQRREQLTEILPIRRVVDATDVGNLAIHLMQNTAITGVTIDIDGGQQLIE